MKKRLKVAFMTGGLGGMMGSHLTPKKMRDKADMNFAKVASIRSNTHGFPLTKTWFESRKKAKKNAESNWRKYL